MAWTSAYNAFGSEPVIRQLLAIINRDIQAALDYVSGAPGSLKPFAFYLLAERPAPNFPAILMFPESIKFDPDVVGALQETIPIYCSCAVAHQDPNQVAVWIQWYALAVMLALQTAFERTVNDFYAAGLALPATAYGANQVTAGLGAGKLLRLFVAQPVFGELRQSAKSLFVKAASMSIEVDLLEPAQ